MGTIFRMSAGFGLGGCAVAFFGNLISLNFGA